MVSPIFRPATCKRESQAGLLAIDASKKEGIERITEPSPGIPGICRPSDLTLGVLRVSGGVEVYKLVKVG